MSGAGRGLGAVAALLLLGACTDKAPGALLAQGVGRGIAVAPGGAAVAFLLDARHPDDRSVPEDLFAGDLYLGSTSGAQPARKVGSGVSSASGSYRFAADGSALAYLAAWRFRAGAGELAVASPGAAARRKLGDDATAFGWSPKGSKLAWVDGGRLFAIDGPAAAPRLLGEAVHSFAWAPDGARLAARSAAAAGAELWLIDASSGERRALAKGVSDYAFASDGALGWLGAPGPKGGDRPLSVLAPGAASPRELGRATSFEFAPSGEGVLALQTDTRPGEATGQLVRLQRSGGAPRPLGAKTSDFRFTPRGDALYLARYDVRSRSGTLAIAPAAGGPAREIAPRVQSFTLDAAGARVLYLVQKPLKGDFKIELWLSDLSSAAAPRKIDEGVYGYEPTTDGKLLFWKARCGMGPRSCSLFRAPLDGSAAPVELAKNVAGFDLSGDASRLLIGAPHRGSSRAVDLSWLPASANGQEKPRPIALDVDPSAKLVDQAGKRAVFAVLSAGKAGVFSTALE